MATLAAEPQRRTYRVRDVASILGISERSAWRLISSRELPCVRFGVQSVRILADDLESFIQRHRETGKVAA